MTSQHLINGCESSSLSVLDRGLLYGDGLFETLWVYQGKPTYWEAHIRRLLQGIEVLSLPPLPISLLETEATRLCQNQTGILKIIITRGIGERGYRPPSTSNLTRILSFFPDLNPLAIKNKFSQTKAKICKLRLSLQPLLAGIKHLNRLEHVLAQTEICEDKIGEGILLSYTGQVISGTMTNLFCIKNKIVYTPQITECGVRGIAREQIIAYCHQYSLPCIETTISLQELLVADEIFLCNSVKGILSITEIEGYSYQFSTEFTEQFLKPALIFE